MPLGDLAGGVTVTDVSVGCSHTCLLLSTGKIKCVGEGTYGQLGHGSFASSLALVDVSLPADATASRVSCGHSFTAVLLSSGRVHTFGRNNVGQLGDGTSTDRSTPVDTGLEDVADLATGYDHVCAVTGSGAEYCFGSNGAYQLFGYTASISPQSTPRQVTDPYDLLASSGPPPPPYPPPPPSPPPLSVGKTLLDVFDRGGFRAKI